MGVGAVWFSDEAREAWTPREEWPLWCPAALLESGNRDGVDVAHGLSPSAPTDRGIPRLAVVVDGAGHLNHPRFVRMRRVAGDVDAPGREVDKGLECLSDRKGRFNRSAGSAELADLIVVRIF